MERTGRAPGDISPLRRRNPYWPALRRRYCAAEPRRFRHHARIVREGEAFVVIDLQSKQGTFLNGRRIDRHRLRAHDRISFGDTGVELLFDTEDHLESNGNLTLWKEAGVARSIRRLATVLPAESGDHSELEKISCLLDFHYSFGKAFSADKTFNHILKSALQISGAERGFIRGASQTDDITFLIIENCERTQAAQCGSYFFQQTLSSFSKRSSPPRRLISNKDATAKSSVKDEWLMKPRSCRPRVAAMVAAG